MKENRNSSRTVTTKTIDLRDDDSSSNEEEEAEVTINTGRTVRFDSTAASASSSPSSLSSSGTALLLINVQNEFTSPIGKLHGDVKEVMESNGMLSKIPKVVADAR